MVRTSCESLVRTLDASDNALVLELRIGLGHGPPSPCQVRVAISLLSHLEQRHGACCWELKHSNAPEISSRHRSVCSVRSRAKFPSGDVGLVDERMASLRM